MADESDRIWKNIDNMHIKIDKLCTQVTAIDTWIKEKEKNKSRNYAVFGGVIAAVVTSVNFIFTFINGQ